ncbi:hypothetical protein CKM354_000327400 [Cercospora kikuchii]|uniref:Uncharacterized protein n=1 Tax=Cercospora kikuchii TaxID=84275 RepID=A0A9P3CAX7_9PEZI|nr:uncharacterized protein CKM354_000327400 [Cercospora kikuchii]GIZ39912.1 hypothetical protein CKM354_000327400 [Cercospora kikuchii]
MPGYPDDPLASRPRERRRDRYDDDYDNEIYRRPTTKARDPSYDAPRPPRARGRRDIYDASDEEDEYVPRRKHKEERPAAKEKPQVEPEIPPPPIGDDRKQYATSARKHRRDHPSPPEPTSTREKSTAKAKDGYPDIADEEYRRRHRSARGSREEDVGVDRDADRKYQSKKASNPPSDDEGGARPPDRKHSRRSRNPYEDEIPVANERRQRKEGRSPYDADPEPAPVARKHSHRHRDDYDDIEPPRRQKARDPVDEEPVRRKDPYAEPTRRRSRRAAYPPEDSDEYDPPPRRRDDRDRRRHEDVGYGTDRPRRAARDDPYERGYRTDGRDARRDRDRDRYAVKRDPRRDDRRRDDRYDDEYDSYHDRRRGSKPRNGKHGGFDMDNIVHKGQKTWEKAAPVAKPLLAQLANTYLNNGRPGGGVPH